MVIRILLLLALLHNVSAFPSLYNCDFACMEGHAPGGVFGQMGIPNFSAAPTGANCQIATDIPTDGHTQGQRYTITVTSSVPLGQKVVCNDQGNFLVGSSMSAASGTPGSSKVTSATYSWTATGSSQASFRALCGAGGNVDQMWVANVVHAAPSMLNPTPSPPTSPTLAQPTQAPPTPASPAPILPNPAPRDVTCFDGNGGFTKALWPFCQKVHEGVLVYYGPSEASTPATPTPATPAPPCANNDNETGLIALAQAAGSSISGCAVIAHACEDPDHGDVVKQYCPYTCGLCPSPSPSPSSTAKFIKLGLYADGHHGWSALALAGNGGMKGAQHFVVRKEAGLWQVEERYSTDYTKPELQQTQEVVLAFASDEGGSTAWGLLVPVTACGAGEKYPIEDVSRFMLWALGGSHNFGYHGNKRGQFHANLISGPRTVPDSRGFEEADLRMHVRMPDVNVVLGDGGKDPSNPYICTVFDLAQLLPSGMSIDDTHHVVKIAPFLSPSSKKYVHHMVLFGCENGVSEQTYGQTSTTQMSFTHNQVIGECQSMPKGCSAMKYLWTVGVDDIVFPANVGMPIGGQRFLVLQMHYYNPSQDMGIKDSSGVQMVLANSLRPHNAAFFVLRDGGPEVRDPLPAGQNDVTLPTMTVPEKCTNTWAVPKINVLGVLHHGHLIGKSFKMEVTRGGRYVGMLRQEKRYDFNHQSFEPSSLSTISRGDELTFTCSYDTSTRTRPTQFGPTSQEEMCVGALLYYPEQTMSSASYVGTGWIGRTRTNCEGVGDTEFFAPRVNPECMPKGDLSSSEAASMISSLRDAHDFQNISSLRDVNDSLSFFVSGSCGISAEMLLSVFVVWIVACLL